MSCFESGSCEGGRGSFVEASVAGVLGDSRFFLFHVTVMMDISKGGYH